MQSFRQEHKPEYTEWQWTKLSIALRIIFPPVLLWDLLKFVVNKLVGRLVGLAILPAQGKGTYERLLRDGLVGKDAALIEQIYRNYPGHVNPLVYKKCNITTYDNVDLDTLEIGYDPQYASYDVKKLPSVSGDQMQVKRGTIYVSEFGQYLVYDYEGRKKWGSFTFNKSLITSSCFDDMLKEENFLQGIRETTLGNGHTAPALTDDKKIREQKYIINFLGNAMAYQDVVHEMQSDAATLKCNVIGFNFRGVGVAGEEFRANSKNDLVIDGIAQVQRLLDSGVPAENITLKGFSLGGGIASLVAHYFHTQEQPKRINLFNNRSFSSVSNVVIGWVRVGFLGGSADTTITGHNEPFGRKLLGWMATPFVKLGLALSQWEINAGDAYKEIPEDNKEYIVVRTAKAKRNGVFDCKDDVMIPHYASLHYSLKGERKKAKDGIKAGNNAAADNTAADNTAADNTDKLQSMKNEFRQRKMTTQHPDVDGHCQPMGEITNRSDNNKRTASAFFEAFVQKPPRSSDSRSAATVKSRSPR